MIFRLSGTNSHDALLDTRQSRGFARLALGCPVVDVETWRGKVRFLRIVSASQVDEPAFRPSIRLLYRAAMRDVYADPAGTLALYQPTWFFPAPRGSLRGVLAGSAANGDRY